LIVLDASAVIEILLQTRAASPLTDRVLSPDASLHAPHLLQVEVVQVLRRFGARGELQTERARQALADLLDFPVELHAHDLLLSRAWELCQNLTIYDAVYIALAELLEAPLLTRDRRLAAARGHTARIELF
jgi:predicted nucleic acid-binding protein